MVHGAYNFIDKIKKYAKPSKAEKKSLLKGISIITITVFITEILRTTILQTITTTQIILSMIFLTLTTIVMILIYETTQKIISIEQGMKTEINYSRQKALISLTSSIITLGFAPLLAYKNTKFHILEKHRVGHIFHGKSVNLMAKSVIGGTIALIVFAAILQLIPLMGSKMSAVVMLYAVANLLPIPNQDGLAILRVHQKLYHLTLSITVLIMAITLIIAT